MVESVGPAKYEYNGSLYFLATYTQKLLTSCFSGITIGSFFTYSEAVSHYHVLCMHIVNQEGGECA